MKKTTHSSPHKKKAPPSPKGIDPVEDVSNLDTPIDEENLAADQFAVVGREDEASSSGHRVEPIQPDEEGNAQALIEEGLHGYLHAIPKNSRQKK